uniref:Transposase n=1 Tax=Strongyloides venezuelensis TaxID=75913 RepID=A0A0K0G3I3_STRVS
MKKATRNQIKSSRSDIIEIFYLEFYSNVPHVAGTISSDKARPYINVCPGQYWNYGSNDFSYEIHRDAEYWQGKSKDDPSGKKYYP